MAQLNAYLKFNGNTREAFEFYKDCLGGELTIETVGKSPMSAQMPTEMKDKILHATLIKDTIMLMGSDMVGPEEYRIGNAFSLCLVCNTREEIGKLFSKLSKGGQVIYPLKEEFFGTFNSFTCEGR